MPTTIEWDAKIVNSSWDSFDPNSAPMAAWATYIPGRVNSAAFKMHKTRGAATSAMLRVRRGIMYEFDLASLRWKIVAKIDFQTPPPDCEKCGTSLEHTYRATPNRTWNEGRVARQKPGLKFLWVCSKCKQALK